MATNSKNEKPATRYQSRLFKATKKANSEKLRKLGNSFYGKAFHVGLAPIIAKDRLLKAVNIYQQAYDAADGDADCMSSARKNSGLAYFRLAKLVWDDMEEEFCFGSRFCGHVDSPAQERKQDEVIQWFEKAFVKFHDAHKLGFAVKGNDWLAGIHDKTQEVYDELLEFTQDFSNFDRRIGKLYHFSKVLYEGKLLADLFHHVAEALFHKAVTCLDDRDFKESLKYLHEMNFPIEEGLKRCSSNYEMRCKLETLKQDSYYQLATSESIQANIIAKNNLDTLLKQEEFLLMDLVFDTLDMFKSAALKARELDLEQEAIAVYYQGVIFRDVLKLEYRVKTLFMHVLFLCEAAKPRVFFFYDWYKDCSACVKKFQEEARDRDESEQQKKKKAHLEKLKPKIDAMRKVQNESSPHKLLKHVYKKHKPKVERQKLQEEDLKQLKKLEEEDREKPYDQARSKKKKMLLLKALQDYHPDKNQEFGEEWVVLCEEISK